MWVKVQVPEDYNSELDKICLIGGLKGDTSLVPYEPTYVKMLNHGHIALMDWMGSDQDVVDAARVSYGKGTRRVSSDRALIRYLLRHRHTTPFEMVQFKFHVKLPIFVARQWIRHRTGSFNEYSARYSKLDAEMYIPLREQALPQSTTNKQGREVKELNENNYDAVVATMEHAFAEAFTSYLYLLGPEEFTTEDGSKRMTSPPPPDAINHRALVWREAAINALMKMRDMAVERGEVFEIDDSQIDAKIKEYYDANKLAIMDGDYPGLARELARCVIPVAVYTQWYWSVNLHNLMHFMRLRSDSHAQYEIRVYSDEIRNLIAPLVPFCMEAFDEYVMGAKQWSKTEFSVIRSLLSGIDKEVVSKELRQRGMTEREITEFISSL